MEKIIENTKIDRKYVITIGRQLGSGGRQIGKKIAEHLKISYYDKELINKAAEESGLNKEFIEMAEEKVKFNLLNQFGLFYNDNFDLNNKTLFEIQSEIIKKIAKEESCIIIGRCSSYVLRETPNLINLFITANEADRIRKTSLKNNISEKQAFELNRKVDRMRKEYHNFYCNTGWGRSSSYHLSINSSLLGIDDTVNFLLQFINNMKLKFS